MSACWLPTQVRTRCRRCEKKNRTKHTRPVTPDSVWQCWQFADGIGIGTCLEKGESILAFDNGTVDEERDATWGVRMKLAAYQNKAPITLLGSTIAMLRLLRPHNQLLAQYGLCRRSVFDGNILLGLDGCCNFFRSGLSYLGLGIVVGRSLLAQRHALSLGFRSRHELLLALRAQSPSRASRRGRATFVRGWRKHDG